MNVAAFCSDYKQGANEYQQSGGDVTDQAFFAFQTSMEKAQAEAPPAVKSDVTAIVNTANKAQSSKYNGDVTQYSQRINAWAASNCPSATTTTDASAGSVTTDPGSCVTDDTGTCATTDTTGVSSTTTFAGNASATNGQTLTGPSGSLLLSGAVVGTITPSGIVCDPFNPTATFLYAVKMQEVLAGGRSIEMGVTDANTQTPSVVLNATANPVTRSFDQFVRGPGSTDGGSLTVNHRTVTFDHAVLKPHGNAAGSVVVNGQVSC